MRMLAIVLTVIVLATGCGSTGPASQLTGSYTATVFRVTPTGQGQIDVLAAGGSLMIVIAESGVTTGTLSLPASVAGGSTFTASMSGTATLTGSRVVFAQGADSFVRDLDWTLSGSTISVTNQTIQGATYTISLTR